MKVIVCGSRSIKNEMWVHDWLDYLQTQIDITEVVTGMAPGPDNYGGRWAWVQNIPDKNFPAQWDKYGKSAGMIRNVEMADYADYVIAFWDGKSRGTKHMIDTMKRKGKHGTVIEYELS